MALNPVEEGEQSITIEREEKMVPPAGGDPIWRNAHFLKPLINPTNQPPPKTPSVSPSSNPSIIKKLTKRVDFKGRPKPPEKWKTWVRDLEETHHNVWKKVGVFDAIKASTYKILRHNELIVVLAEKWCPKTNTFIFPWGECTVTLEDVMILGGFSVLGGSVICYSESREFDEIVTKLATACSEIKAKCRHSVTHNGWMNHFKGKGGELEHVALLVLWLSRYVFSANSFFRTNQDVFDIAIRLAKGIKVALAPAALALIYRDLGLLKKYFATFTSRRRGRSSGLVLLAPFQFVQLWAWERFPCLSPKPNSLMLGEPRLARWHSLRKLEIKGLREELEAAGDHFLWRPYALNLKNWDFPKFYSDKERWVLVNSEVDDELLSFARCLRACELVAMDCLEQYCPHRVAMQFGLDQDIPDSLPRSLAYDKPLDGWWFYLPHRLAEGDVTYQYSNWWKEAFRPDDHMLIVYKRKTSPRKVESLYHILTTSLGSDDNRALVCFHPNDEPVALNFVGVRTELMLVENPPSVETVQEIETLCDRDGSSMAENEALIGKEPQVVEMKQLGDDDNRAPVCIPHNKEAMPLDFVGSRTESMLVEKPPSCETVQAVETLCDQNGSSMAENEALICKDPQVAEMKHLGDDGSKAPLCAPSNKDAVALEVVEPRTELMVIKKPPSCEAKQENETLHDQNGPSVAENEAHVGKNPLVDEKKQLASRSVHDVVVINDDVEQENDTDSVSRLKLRESELEARIRKLERVVSMLKRNHRL